MTTRGRIAGSGVGLAACVVCCAGPLLAGLTALAAALGAAAIIVYPALLAGTVALIGTVVVLATRRRRRHAAGCAPSRTADLPIPTYRTDGTAMTGLSSAPPPRRGDTLADGRVQVHAQDRIDDRLIGIDLRGPRRELLALLGPHRRQRL